MILTTELQDLVDALAQRLCAPVSIDDTRFRLVAYSSQGGELDDVRLASILARVTAPAVVDWVRERGVHRLIGWGRLPANVDLGMRPRLVVPIRAQDGLLGYVWTIEPDGGFSAGDIDSAVQTAADAAVLMYRERVRQRHGRDRELELLEDLLRGEADSRASAAAELCRDGSLTTVDPTTVVVARPVPPEPQPVDDGLQVALAAGLERARRLTVPRHARVCADGDQLILVLSADRSTVAAAAEAVFDAGRVAVESRPGWRVVVGVGDSRAMLIHAGDSLLEAERAADVAARVGALGDLVYWCRLGAYRPLSALLPGMGTGPGAIPELIRRILEHSEGLALLQTLETYVECAGDAQATASALYLHRSTLYNRLRRVEDITGVSLKDGDGRLNLHLAVRLWRLAGGTV